MGDRWVDVFRPCVRLEIYRSCSVPVACIAFCSRFCNFLLPCV